MEHTRAHIRLMTTQDAIELVSLLNSDGTADKYVLESADGTSRVDARSFLGVLYFTTEHNDDTYLVNMTNPNNVFPTEIDRFRV